MNLGVIFDMDGVLVDSTEAHFRSWQALAAEVGTPYPRSVFDRTYGMHNRQSIPIWLGRDVSDPELQRLSDRKEEQYRQAARQTLQEIPGAADLARRLKADGFRLAVGTSGPLANARLALEILDLARVFDAVSSGDEVQDGKPDPAIFLNAARRLGLPPSHCAVIEDSPPGIEAARRAGMLAIAIPTSRKREELTEADWLAPDLPSLSPAAIRERLLAQASQPRG